MDLHARSSMNLHHVLFHVHNLIHFPIDVDELIHLNAIRIFSHCQGTLSFLNLGSLTTLLYSSISSPLTLHSPHSYRSKMSWSHLLFRPDIVHLNHIKRSSLFLFLNNHLRKVCNGLQLHYCQLMIQYRMKFLQNPSAFLFINLYTVQINTRISWHLIATGLLNS